LALDRVQRHWNDCNPELLAKALGLDITGENFFAKLGPVDKKGDRQAVIRGSNILGGEEVISGEPNEVKSEQADLNSGLSQGAVSSFDVISVDSWPPGNKQKEIQVDGPVSRIPKILTTKEFKPNTALEDEDRDRVAHDINIWVNGTFVEEAKGCSLDALSKVERCLRDLIDWSSSAETHKISGIWPFVVSLEKTPKWIQSHAKLRGLASDLLILSICSGNVLYSNCVIR